MKDLALCQRGGAVALHEHGSYTKPDHSDIELFPGPLFPCALPEAKFLLRWLPGPCALAQITLPTGQLKIHGIVRPMCCECYHMVEMWHSKGSRHSQILSTVGAVPLLAFEYAPA